MRFIRVVPNETTEYQINLDLVVMVQVNGPFAYVQLLHHPDKIMVPAAEWQRVSVMFPPSEFPVIRESDSKTYVVNLAQVTHIHVTTGFSYLHLAGVKDRIMIKPEVWAEISILFPAQ